MIDRLNENLNALLLCKLMFKYECMFMSLRFAGLEMVLLS